MKKLVAAVIGLIVLTSAAFAQSFAVETKIYRSPATVKLNDVLTITSVSTNMTQPKPITVSVVTGWTGAELDPSGSSPVDTVPAAADAVVSEYLHWGGCTFALPDSFSYDLISCTLNGENVYTTKADNGYEFSMGQHIDMAPGESCVTMLKVRVKAKLVNPLPEFLQRPYFHAGSVMSNAFYGKKRVVLMGMPDAYQKVIGIQNSDGTVTINGVPTQVNPSGWVK